MKKVFKGDFMKVVMLCKWNKHNLNDGVSVHVNNLVQELSKFDDLNLNIISFGDTSEVFFNGKTQIVLIKAYKLYYLLPFLAIIKLALELRKINPDIIHVQGANVSPYLFYTMFIRGYKKVITYHSYPSRELVANGKLKLNSLRYKILKILERNTFNKFDIIITVTKILKKWLEDDFVSTENKIFPIPNGVDTSSFDYKINNEYFRKKLNLSEEDYLIFHAKSFDPYNGQEYLIRSMPKILGEYPNIKLILAGDGPTKSKMIEVVKKLDIPNNVIFLGKVQHEEIPFIIFISDLIVIPSVQMNGFEEGSSIFSLEAMAMKKPVIASNIGGFKDSIIDGNNGLLIPDRDSDAIANKVLKLVKDPIFANKLGENALFYVKNERSWLKIALDTLEIYKKIIK